MAVKSHVVKFNFKTDRGIFGSETNETIDVTLYQLVANPSFKPGKVADKDRVIKLTRPNIAAQISLVAAKTDKGGTKGAGRAKWARTIRSKRLKRNSLVVRTC